MKSYSGKNTFLALIAASIYFAVNTIMLLFSPLVSPPSPVSGVVVSAVDAAGIIF